MPNTTAFPQLTRLMGAYLNQDFDLLHASEEAAILEFARTSWAEDVRAALGEIDAMLAGPGEGLLARYAEQTGPWDLRIGETDAQARAWLVDTRALMAGVLERGEAAEAPPPRRRLLGFL